MTRALVFGVAVLALARPAVAQTPADVPVIVAEGDAVIHRAPDRAWIAVSTDTRDTRADVARRTSAEAMTALERALKDAGVAADGIRTTSYSLTPDVEWSNGRSIPKGYVVHNQIEVRVDTLDMLASVIDAADASKGSSLSVTGPRFDLKDESSAENDALRMAVTSAMARAAAIAEGAHRALGPIRRIEENNLGPSVRPMPMQMAVRSVAAAPPTPTPVDPGEIEIHAHVTLTAELR